MDKDIETKREKEIQIPKVSNMEVGFEQTDDPNKSLQNTVAYLKGLDKVPEDWKKVEWKTETRAGIFQAICQFNLKPEV